jgi:hypothetical protein
MKAKYFYAPAIFSIVPKIYVLTEDLDFYTEVRECSVVTIEKHKASSFINFNTENFETEDYPVLLEIQVDEATETSLNLQVNWVNRYISEKGVNLQMAKQA